MLTAADSIHALFMGADSVDARIGAALLAEFLVAHTKGPR